MCPFVGIQPPLQMPAVYIAATFFHDFTFPKLFSSTELQSFAAPNPLLPLTARSYLAPVAPSPHRAVAMGRPHPLSYSAAPLHITDIRRHAAPYPSAAATPATCAAATNARCRCGWPKATGQRWTPGPAVPQTSNGRGGGAPRRCRGAERICVGAPPTGGRGAQRSGTER